MSGGQEGVALAGVPSERAQALLDTVRKLSIEDLTWLSGYSAGVAAGRATAAAPARAVGAPAAAVAAPVAAAASPITVLYGTHSGTSRALAERLAQKLSSNGASVRLVRASDYATRELAKEKTLVLVVATHGDGDPADDTRAFYEHVLGRRAAKLPDLKFAVLGLGDASYPKFCHVARKLDERLAELGAQRLRSLGECDVDFETVAGPWIDQTVAALSALASPGPRDAVVIPLHGAAAAAIATKTQPAVATVLVNQAITARDAGKRVLHLELAFEEAAVPYQTGDALAVWPHNPAWLVDELIGSLGLRGDQPVSRDTRERPLAQWLTSELEITKLSRPVLAALAERSKDDGLAALLRPGAEAALAELLATHQITDVVQRYAPGWSAAELVAALRPLAPRSYSIASSPLAFPGEAHLTVAHVAYANAQGKRRAGSGSDYLARAALDDSVRVFLEPNPSFRLPAPDVDVIMIGPGTGVAPFRAFVQEREIIGGTGKSWLFFGEQYRRSQFLYQLEWQAAVKRGSLARIDLAFSRDQADKIYVQHRLVQRGADVYAWLQRGAHLYVCGDAKRMAPDVEAALLAIAMEHGGKDVDQAQEWLSELRAQRRYHRDVY
jgi:sulfite reductase (NADPH) flavoprotein alpha-component